MSKPLDQKVEEWIAEALVTVAPVDDVNLELASTSDETASIKRVIVDCSQTNIYAGTDPIDGDFSTEVTVNVITSVDRVSAEEHGALADSVKRLLYNEETMRTAALEIPDFYLTYFSFGSATTTAGDDNGMRVRSTPINLSAVVRDDDGTG